MKPKRRKTSDKNLTSNVESPVPVISIISSPDNICSICFAEFVDPEELTRHVIQVHLSKFSKRRYCTFCSELLPSLEAFARHLLEKHIIDLRACEFCCRVYNDKAKMLVHQKKHQYIPTKSIFSCSQCPILFQCVEELEKHEYEEHEDCFDGIILNSCFPYLSSMLNIKAPSFLQSVGVESLYMCVVCGEKTSDINSYIDHLKREKCVSVVCDTCSNVYKNVASLKKHFIKNSKCLFDKSPSQVNILCKKCNKYFDVNAHRIHQSVCTSQSDDISCRNCNINFSSVDELTEHQSSEHPVAIIIRLCKYCQNEFVGNVALEKHIERTHKHEIHLYKYHCKTCNHIYKHPKKLFSHFFTQHKNLHPYTCKICYKTFKVRKSFSLHIKLIHNSEGKVEFDENFHVYFKNNPNKYFINEHDYSIKQFQFDTTKNDPSDKQATVNEDSGYNKDNGDIPVSESALESNAEDEKTKHDHTLAKGKNLKTGENVKPTSIDDINNKEPNESSYSNDNPKAKGKKKSSKIYSSRRQRAKQIGNKKKTQIEYEDETYLESSDEDYPLSRYTKKRKPKCKARYLAVGNTRKKIFKSKGVTTFSCTICKKYCYTFQNYNRHMSFHYQNEFKPCIKCGVLFKKKKDLEDHMKKEHSQSKLTDTLQMLLNRRKSGPVAQKPLDNLSKSDKFKLTVKKVDLTSNVPIGKVHITPKDLSAKNFIESFTPDASLEKKEPMKAVSIRLVSSNRIKKPLIEFTKVNICKPPITSSRLAMPVKFKNTPELHKAKISMAQVFQQKNTSKLNFGIRVDKVVDYNVPVESDNYHQDDYVIDEVDNRSDHSENIDQNTCQNEPTISDVDHEELLEETEEIPQKTVQRKILIPHLPPGYNEVRIAHLQPEAPYYKIVKVEDILKPEEKEIPTENLKLPEGKKLINVNPLEHLLGDNEVKIYTNKYYKSKMRNIKNTITKAILDLDNPNAVKKTRKKRDKTKT